MIARLADLPELAPTLAAAHARDWAHLYEPTAWNEAVALAEFRAESAAAPLPVTLVLRRADGTLVGSVSLVHDDLPDRPDLNPWLASLYVFPEFRGQGHARTLVQAALAHLRAAGIGEAFLFTEYASGLFAAGGFVAIGDAHAQGRAVTLMRWRAATTGQ